ncbi:hypothetical protein ACJDT4_01885 [Clostridium neuense]|uniref:Uncharacterized protein n=1 Tax=Clostridium neuense TaxID=1728934 RepID=A0ABW8TBS5_9CLOT
MDYDSKTLSQYKDKVSVEKYLSNKYKMTVMTINIKNSLSSRNELPDDSMMELIETIAEDSFKEDIFLKIFAVTDYGPVFFMVINKSYETVKTISDKVVGKYFLKCNIFVNVVKYN